MSRETTFLGETRLERKADLVEAEELLARGAESADSSMCNGLISELLLSVLMGRNLIDEDLEGGDEN